MLVIEKLVLEILPDDNNWRAVAIFGGKVKRAMASRAYAAVSVVLDDVKKDACAVAAGMEREHETTRRCES